MSDTLKMKMMPEEERPYEKCELFGTESLTDAELLAVILRSGVQGMTAIGLAEKILNLSDFEKGLTGIYHLSREELCSLKGVGRVKANQILCIGELSKRIARSETRKKLNFNDPSSVAAYFTEKLRHEEQEQLFCLMLDMNNGLLGEVMLSKGTVNQSLLSPRELMIKALSYRAVHLILVHNHPSGNPTPSEEDILITKQVCEAGELIGVSVIDHIIVGDKDYCSLREMGDL